jgi:glycosidase
MIYNGQEAGNRKRLAFFEKDEIVWQSHPIGDLYAKLFQLKKQNSALWNGEWGARMVHVPNSNQSTVLSFVRQDENSKIMVILNLSAEPQTVRFDGTLFPDDYADYFAGERLELLSDTEMTLNLWAYKVLVADK